MVLTMAYGGVPVYQFSQPGGVSFRNFIRIDGLTLDPYTGGVVDPAFAYCGELTTAVPGPNQIGLPTLFGRGRGRWRAGDQRMVEEGFEVVLPPVVTGLAVPAAVLGFPVVVAGDLVLRRFNFMGDPSGPQPVRLYVRYNHTTFV